MTFGEMVRPVTSCPGVVATAIADRDGIPVESWGVDASRIEELVAEYSAFLRDVTSANRDLQIGPLEQVVVVGSERSVFITTIVPDYYLVTLVEKPGNSGKARFASRVAAFRLRGEFA